MNNKLKKKEIIALIIAGILFTVTSFLYYYLSKEPSKTIVTILCVLDLSLCFINVYKISIAFDKGKIISIFISLLVIILFLGFIELTVLLFTLDSSITFNYNLFINVLLIGIFLSPSIIILLPVIWFIAECLG